jgi:hypothetical protein
MPLSPQEALAQANHYAGVSSLPAVSTIYIAMLAEGVELSGNGYARIVVDSWDPPESGSNEYTIANAEDEYTPNATDDWAESDEWQAFRSASGDDPINAPAAYAGDATVTVTAGNRGRIPAGSLVLSIPHTA